MSIYFRYFASAILSLGLPCLALGANTETSSGDRIVKITSGGVVPVQINKKVSARNAGETLYLESVVAPPKPQKRLQPNPKPTPTPKPRAVEPPKAPAPPPASTPVPPPPKTKNSPPPASSSKTSTETKAAPTITITKDSAKPSLPEKNKPAAKAKSEDLDEYSAVASIPDPIEPVNRGFFWFNHQLYTFVGRPISKAYTFIIPQPVRGAVHNVYENIEFPVRLVNNLLQLNFRRADLETRKFVVNSVAGVGGIFRVSDRIPSLADIPPADTGQTLAKWGVPHGAYIVIPVLGPRSARETVGFVGDYALNPVSWVPFAGGVPAVALAVSTPNSVRNVHERLEIYDAATKNTIDPYIATRSAYSQYRDQAAKK